MPYALARVWTPGQYYFDLQQYAMQSKPLTTLNRGDWIVESQFEDKLAVINQDWFRASPGLDLETACAMMAERKNEDAHTYFDVTRISYRLRNVKTSEIIPGEIFG